MIFINVSTSAPVNEFVTRGENWIEQTNRENLDEDRLDDIFEAEFNKIATSKTKDEWISMYKSYDSLNPITKFSNLLLSVTKECMETSLEKFNN
jgi:hypothetical protein